MGDAHLNPVLTHILRAEHDINTDDAEADYDVPRESSPALTEANSPSGGVDSP